MLKYRLSKEFLILNFLFFSVLGCGEGSTADNGDIQVKPAAALNVKDVANSGNGSDFELSFSIPADRDLISEFRIYVVKTTKKESFNSSTALQSSSYVSIDKSTSEERTTFDSNLSDTDGDVIVENTSYTFFMLTVAEDGSSAAISTPSNDIILEQKNAVRTFMKSINAGSGGMEVDASGNIYMADFGSTLSGGGTRVYKITPQGEPSVFASGFNGASGNDIASDGTIFQSSITGGFISTISTEGTVNEYARTGLVGPVGVTVAPDGALFVADCGSHSIKKVDTNGEVIVFSESSLLAGTCPNGIDIDSDLNLYIAAFGTGNIFRVEPDGTTSVFATVPGSNNGHLLISGNLMYVVARGIHQIYTIDLTSKEVKLFAGTGARGLSNGELSQATFSHPNDLAFSPDGSKLYINDVDPDAGVQSNLSPVYIRVIDIVEN